MLRDPEYLLLDEATSNLDIISEKTVHEAILKLINNRTTIVVAHRLSTVLSADKIFVLENGKITVSGSHESLLHSNHYYNVFVTEQMETRNRIQTI